MRTWRCVASSLLLAVTLTSCVGSAHTVCRPDPISGNSQCSVAGGYEEAAITAGAATAVWAAAGCTINGCEPPFRCNSATKQCERLSCNEGRDCPPGYMCHHDDQRCH